MINEANINDQRELYQLWKSAYPTMNTQLLRLKSEMISDNSKCVTLRIDNKIVSAIQMNKMILSFKNRKFVVDYLLQSATLPDYRRKGYMHQLMQSVMDESSHRHMFTFVKAYYPKLYEKYGFEVIYERKKYHIRGDALKDVKSKRISNEASSDELLQAYKEFIKHFDAYFERDITYYEQLLKELKIGIKHLVVYRNSKDIVCGYAIYSSHKNIAEVEEIVYLDSNALSKMLKAVLGYHKMVVVEVSSKERLERLFPQALVKRQSYMMAKLNYNDLFEKLYRCKVKGVKDAYDILQKPMWAHVLDY